MSQKTCWFLRGSLRGCAHQDALDIDTTFDLFWLAQFECETIEGDLRINTSLADLSLLDSIREVTGDLTLTAEESAASTTPLSNLQRVVGIFDASDIMLSGTIEFPELTEVGVFRLERHEGATGVSLPKLEVADAVEINRNDLLQALDVASLKTANIFEVQDNPTLTRLEAPTLESTVVLSISNNPGLPQCTADRLADRMGRVCSNCEGNQSGTACE